MVPGSKVMLADLNVTLGRGLQRFRMTKRKTDTKEIVNDLDLVNDLICSCHMLEGVHYPS
jgi:hypothetical protein